MKLSLHAIRYTSIENPTLAHFRHFSSLFTNFSSTFVENPLQIRLFMQNKAKFRKSQMNVSDYMTREYEKMDTWWSGKKQSQTKPNKANFQKAQMNVNKVLTKDYEKISNWAIYENEANFNPKQTQSNPIPPPWLEINDLLLTELANRKSRI